MKVFVVSTDNRNPDDFNTWVVGVFNDLEDAENAAVRSIKIPCKNNPFMKNFRIIGAWETAKGAFDSPNITHFMVSWEMDGKNGKHEGVDVFEIQEVEIGAVYDEDLKEIKGN